MLLRDALRVELKKSLSEGEAIYAGDVSGSWGIKGIPHGGYALGVIIRAVSAFQSTTPHPDPIHTTAHYLQPLDSGACEIRIKRIRAGKKMANIDAELIQDSSTRISARFVCGTLPDLSTAQPSSLTLVPPSPLARRVPLSQHPSGLRADPLHPYWLGQTVWEDQYYLKRNAEKARAASPASPPSDNDGLEWAAWIGLGNKSDGPVEHAMLPFFADCMKNLPALLPEDQQPGPTWFATVLLTIEFKSKIPPAQEGVYSPHTVGLYSSARFIADGRHDEYVELWTAPTDIGSGVREDPNWREKQVCLAVSTQMALSIPESRSRRAQYNAEARSKL